MAQTWYQPHPRIQSERAGVVTPQRRSIAWKRKPQGGQSCLSCGKTSRCNASCSALHIGTLPAQSEVEGKVELTNNRTVMSHRDMKFDPP